MFTCASKFVGSMTNGQWIIEDIDVISYETTDNSGCCGRFSELTYKLSLVRKPKYLIFYLVTPIIILLVLSVLSFFIPTESGERIGFVTTILLSLIVFLEMIPEYLPRSSDQIPILGLFMIISLSIISLVLISTIFIVLCHFREGVPPHLIKRVFWPLNTKKGQANLHKANESAKEENISPAEETKKRNPARNIPEDEEKEDYGYTWQDIGRKMNWISFGLIFVGSMAAILHLSYIDSCIT